MLDVGQTLIDIVVDWILPVLFALAYLAGLVLAIILAVRAKAKAATLAAIAFGLLLVKHLAAWWFSIPIYNLVYDVIEGSFANWVVSGLDCCCGVLQLAAVVCLVIAVWQAVSPSMPKEV
jgi:hypothetical protein